MAASYRPIHFQLGWPLQGYGTAPLALDPIVGIAMSLVHALVLGITQGLAEFLPISSSGHLELIPWLLGWDDFAGDARLENAFDVALHVGTLVGALAYLWSDVVRYTRAGLGALMGRHEWSADARIAWMLLVSAFPAATVGVLLEGYLLDLAENIVLIAGLLIVFGLLLFWADRRPAGRSGRAVDAFSWRDAALMGAGQACALLPGVSRSGVTMTVGRALHFDRTAAARLAFLMSLPLIGGAGIYRGLTVASDGFPVEMLGGFLVGMAAATLTGWCAVWATLRFLRSRTSAPFVAYRLVVGFGILTLVMTGVR